MTERNPTEARVLTEWDPVGLRVQIVQRAGDGGYTALTFPEMPVRVYVPPDEAYQTPPDHTTLRLTDDEGRALYEALAEHFGHGTHDARAVRKDYEAERRRVDGLIATVSAIASATTGVPR